MTLKLRIMVRAAKLRVKAGETLDAILGKWPALTDAERAEIRGALDAEGAGEPLF